MTNADLLPATVLKRKAVVYVRQSTQAQVHTNLESQRRQYERKRPTMTAYRNPWKFALVSTSYRVDTNCDADIDRHGI